MTDLKQFIKELNKAWMEHRYDDLYEYFHEDVVMLPPGSNKPITGIEPMIESYRQFGTMGTIHKFNIADISIYDFKSAAICHVQFDVDYEIEAGRFQEKGLEVNTIVTSGLEPKIIWRTQVIMKTDNS
jgi:ketosteroid isomerase-like protein